MSEREADYEVKAEAEAQAPEPVKQEPPARAKRQKRLDVRVVERQGVTACVQWAEGDWLRRGWVPAEEVRDNQASEDALSAAVPVGVRWEERLDLKLDNAALARALYRRGLFTARDLARKPEVEAAIREAIGPVYIAILRMAEE